MIQQENGYIIGPLVVAFCTPFYFFYGLGCFLNVWPELVSRNIEQRYNIFGSDTVWEDWFAWWLLLGITCCQVFGILKALQNAKKSR